jgi:hypothetical protein
MCGIPGGGKSMRAQRLKFMLCDGWVEESGGGSAKAGQNGGMDVTCGRLCYYDELPEDFTNAHGNRMEYLKRITMEQSFQHQRSVKCTNFTTGADSFQTQMLYTIHYESHVASTNCGVLGLKSSEDPTTTRLALSDRSFAHVVHPYNESPDGDAASGNSEFRTLSRCEEVQRSLNKLRVVSCLTAFVLIFIKHIPQYQPDFTFATNLCSKFDDILWNEYNLPKPSRRKLTKRRMLLQLFAVESAVVQKFVFQDFAMDYKDMVPNADGSINPFSVDQLVDVVVGLQRCLDHEARDACVLNKPRHMAARVRAHFHTHTHIYMYTLRR